MAKNIMRFTDIATKRQIKRFSFGKLMDPEN